MPPKYDGMERSEELTRFEQLYEEVKPGIHMRREKPTMQEPSDLPWDEEDKELLAESMRDMDAGVGTQQPQMLQPRIIAEALPGGGIGYENPSVATEPASEELSATSTWAKDYPTKSAQSPAESVVDRPQITTATNDGVLISCPFCATLRQQLEEALREWNAFAQMNDSLMDDVKSMAAELESKLSAMAGGELPTAEQLQAERQIVCRELNTEEGYIPPAYDLYEPYLVIRIQTRFAQAIIAAQGEQIAALLKESEIDLHSTEEQLAEKDSELASLRERMGQAKLIIEGAWSPYPEVSAEWQAQKRDWLKAVASLAAPAKELEKVNDHEIDGQAARKNAKPIVCEYCGDHCYGGAEHNERVENGDRWDDGARRAETA